MAYKLSKGSRGFGDINFEDDADTGIDFEEDTVKIETGGAERLVVANTNITSSVAFCTQDNLIVDGRIGIGTGNPSYKLEIGGSMAVGEYIYHRNDTDTYIRFQDNDVRIATGGSERLVIDNQAVLVKQRTNSVVKNALQGTSTATAVLRDTSFTGLSNNNFTVSCWFYANDTNSDPMTTNSRIIFFGAGEHHMLDLRVPDIKVQYENHAGTNDYAEFDTNLEEGNWYHIVAHFDVANLSSGVPRLWVNGAEINGTGYTAVGGTAATIDDVAVYLDDGTAMQDVVFWDKLLSDCEIAEIYNAGNYIDPSTHSAASSIVSWFKMGYEPDFANAGFSAGDTLSGDIDLDDSIGSNSFTLTLESEFSLLARTVTEYVNQADSNEPGIDVDAKAIRIRHAGTPCSASSVGMKGEIRWDANYLYICVATDTWKRVALSTW